MLLVLYVYLDIIGLYYIIYIYYILWFVDCLCVINECIVFEEGFIIFCLYICI